MAEELLAVIRDPTRLDVLRHLALLDSPTEDAFDRMTRLATKFLRAPTALVSIVDENRQFFKSCMGLPEPWASRRETPLSHSFCKHLVVSGKPLVIEDARQHPLFRDNRAIPEIGIVAYLGMPLVTAGGVVLGSFCVIDRVPRAWTADDMETLRDLAATVMTEIELRGEIIERQRLEEAQAGQMRLATFSAEAAAALTGNDSLPDMLHACAAAMVRHLRASFARIWTLGPSADVLELQASAGMYTHLDGPHSRVPVGQLKIGLIAQERQPHLTNDVLNDPRVSDPEWARREGMRAFAGYPLLVGDRLIGVMALFSRDLLDDSTLKALETVAGGLALGIVRKCSEDALRQAHEDLERKVHERTAALRQANQELQAEIGERRRAEEVVREQAELLNKTTDAILVRDLDNRIRFWNRGAELLYGWPAAEVAGKSAFDLLFKEASPALEEALRLTLKNGEWMGELRQVTKEGRDVIVESRWTLVRNARGMPQALLTINTDVTEKKQVEAQYLRAQRMEGIGTLAGGIAHDLNNMLTPITMAVDLLARSLRDKAQQSLLEVLRTSAARGADMVKQILLFARGAEGIQGVLQPKHVLNDIVKMLQHTFPKSVEIDVSLSQDLWTISGDPTLIHQVLLNLCVNARDAMPRGGRLTISAANVVLDDQYARMHPQAKPGRYVVARVADTGAGVPAPIVDKIFDPFFTTKGPGKGTGLGLATVLGIVKGHGGFIDVLSEMGKGTQFSIYLPALEAGTIAPAKEVQVDLPPGAGEMILVVDDEAGIRDITQATLEAHGYRVVTASDGAEAVALYSQNRGAIQAVLMDMMMPVMDGPATVRALQRLDSAVRIVAMSGLVEPGKSVEILSGGVRAFLLKPFTAATLLKTLREVLQER